MLKSSVDLVKEEQVQPIYIGRSILQKGGRMEAMEGMVVMFM
jgi:hypothetical protein